MPRTKQVYDIPLQSELTREIKTAYGAFLSKSQVRKYLCIGKNAPIPEGICEFHITPGKVCYRAADIAAYVASTINIKNERRNENGERKVS